MTSTTYPTNAQVDRGAVISDDGLYRYRLTRRWNRELMNLPFIMLNPSTADATDDDPTIRRCVGFARTWGFGGISVHNLYAFRATKPADLWAHDGDIVGPDNDRRLRNLLEWARLAKVPVVAAWGAHAKPFRVHQLKAMPGAAEVLHCLGRTKDGAPRHPLYLPADAELVLLRRERVVA